MALSALEEARAYALRLLTFQSRTARQIEGKLLDKGFERELVRQVLVALKEQGLINDEEYARSFVAGKVTGRPQGKIKLRYDLVRKGVSGALVSKVLDELGDAYEYEAALALAESKSAMLAAEPDAKKRMKRVYDFLRRKGFHFSVASEIARKVGRHSP